MRRNAHKAGFRPRSATGAQDLKSALQASPKGLCPVVIDYHSANAGVELSLPETYRLKPSDACLKNMAPVLDRDAVVLDYGGS